MCKNFPLIQCDFSGGACGYETFGFSSEFNKYGFLAVNYDCESYSRIYFNDVNEYEDWEGAERGTYAKLAELEIGETTTIQDGTLYIRLF